jgi:hypothetical protein
MEAEIAKFREYGKMKFFNVGYKKLCINYSSASSIIKKHFKEDVSAKIISVLENFDVETIGRIIPSLYFNYAISIFEFSMSKISIVDYFKEKYGVIGDPLLCLMAFSYLESSFYDDAKKIFWFAKIDSFEDSPDFKVNFDFTVRHTSHLIYSLFGNHNEEKEKFMWKLENIPLALKQLDEVEKILWSCNNNSYRNKLLTQWQNSNMRIGLLREFKNRF